MKKRKCSKQEVRGEFVSKLEETDIRVEEEFGAGWWILKTFLRWKYLPFIQPQTRLLHFVHERRFTPVDEGIKKSWIQKKEPGPGLSLTLPILKSESVTWHRTLHTDELSNTDDCLRSSAVEKSRCKNFLCLDLTWQCSNTTSGWNPSPA